MQNQEVYGTWKILYKAEGKDMYHCKCIKCNIVEKDIRGRTLREKPPVCECMNTGTANTDLAVQKEIEQRYVNEPDYKKLGARAHNLYGKTFGSWEVLYYVGDRKWRCRCTCGCNTVSDIVGYTLEAGKPKGHNKSALIDETNNIYGKLKVLDYDKDLKKWRCQCECGNIHYATAKDLRNHDVTSCGRCYKGQNLKGMHFGEWEVLGYAGDLRWHCRCSCGTERDVLAQNLLNDRSTSCGCKSGEKKAESFKSTMMDRYGELNWKRIDMPRQRWQVETLASKDKLIAFIKQLENSLGHRVTYTDLANKLDTSYRAITSRVYEYGIKNSIDVGGNRSIKENELYMNLKSSNNCNILNNVRDTIPSCELDIYIPDSRIAVEFNGSFWHSDAKKDNPRYHQRKSILAAQNNIRLIHIYEFEYARGRDKVRDWINYFIRYDKCTDINGNTVNITSIDIVNKFLSENNIETVTAKDAYACLGCTYNNELYAVVVVNKRTDGSYEITNYTSKIGYRTTSWFNSIINMLSNMSKKEVYCRCSLDKPLHAREIEQLGGKILKISDPTYVWVTNEGELSNGYTKGDLEILNKYPGMTYNTEDDIMRALRNNKLYKAGFILYTFIRGGK